MKYIRAKAGFIRYPDDALIVTANRIIKCLQTSPYFTDPIPSLSEVEAAFADYFDKVIQARDGGIVYNAARRESKAKLAGLFQQLVVYINRVSDGDLIKLHSSGFPVLDKKRKGQAPKSPQNPYLMDGQRSGEVAYGFKPVGRDMLYEFCFASSVDRSGQPIWGVLQSCSRSFRAYQGGFVTGSSIYFRVRARNRHGVSNWSITVVWMVR